jgi:hypothetical protein
VGCHDGASVVSFEFYAPVEQMSSTEIKKYRMAGTCFATRISSHRLLFKPS